MANKCASIMRRGICTVNVREGCRTMSLEASVGSQFRRRAGLQLLKALCPLAVPLRAHSTAAAAITCSWRFLSVKLTSSLLVLVTSLGLHPGQQQLTDQKQLLTDQSPLHSCPFQAAPQMWRTWRLFLLLATAFRQPLQLQLNLHCRNTLRRTRQTQAQTQPSPRNGPPAQMGAPMERSTSQSTMQLSSVSRRQMSMW